MSELKRASRAKMLAALTTLSVVCAAHGATAVPGSAAAVLERARSQAAALRARAQAGGAIDTTPPTLTKFSLGDSVDAQQQGAAAVADMTLTDDLSGIQFVTLTLSSPSGAQSATLYNILSSGEKKYSGRFGVGGQDLLDFGGHFTRFSEPGTWTASSLFVADANGNLALYFGSDLAALGRAAVEVKNDGGYDITPPTLARGQVVTRKISLTTPPAGTAPGTTPFIDGALEVVDTGNGAVSGAYIASMSFCLPDPFGNCLDTIELDGKADAPHLARTVLRMSGIPHAGQVPGKYGLYQVFLQDIAGNATVITTGLADLFPKGLLLTITP